jgi:hypothetical protein
METKIQKISHLIKIHGAIFLPLLFREKKLFEKELLMRFYILIKNILAF